MSVNVKLLFLLSSKNVAHMEFYLDKSYISGVKL